MTLNGEVQPTPGSRPVSIRVTNGQHSRSSSSSSSSSTFPSASPSSFAPSPSHVAPLPSYVKWSYGVGHVLNDLVASCWFSYLLVFLRTVLLFPSTQSGLLLLIGQISDGAATPVVGLLSDRTQSAFGKRRLWILLGSVMVMLTFPPIFHSPLLPLTSMTAKVLYFALFIVLFQFAWASVQVSHLALVPELTRDSDERVYLNSLRSIFTILANLAVFLLAFAILSGHDERRIGPSDLPSFFQLALWVVAIGSVFSLLFVAGVPEPVPRPKKVGQRRVEWYTSQHTTAHHFPTCAHANKHPQTPRHAAVSLHAADGPSLSLLCVRYHWFGRLSFYQTAVIYTCTRLMVNVSQTFIPLFLLVTLHAPKSTIASVPLTVFGAGLLSTCVCERLTRRLGSEGLTFVGCVTVLLSCVGTYCIPATSPLSPYVYVIAFLLGSGTGIVGVSALSLICDLVGDCCESGAFVYGSMSFSDKIANGVAIMVAEALTPLSACEGEEDFQEGDPCLKVTAEEETYYRWVMILAPGGSAILASLMLAFILLTKHRRGAGSAALDSSGTSSVTVASSAFSGPGQLLSYGPCGPHEWEHTTASALQGVRGVVVNSPMPDREVGSGGEEGAASTEATPLLSSSYKG